MEAIRSWRINPVKIEEFLIGLSVFVSSYVFFKSPFEGYFHYLIFILFLPFFIAKYGWPQSTIKLLLLPSFFSLFCVFIGENSFFNFFKIFAGLLLSVSFYYYVFVHYEFNVFSLFKLYLKGAVIVSIIGLVQLISYYVGFKFGYDFKWIFNKWGLVPGGLVGVRINSIFSEPSQFGIMLSPAIFVSIQHLMSRKFLLLSLNECLLICFMMIFAASSTGYIGVFLSLLLIAINFGRILDLIVIGIFVYLAFALLYQNVEEFKVRVDSYTNILGKEELGIEDINSSSFVLYNNYVVATKSLAENPLIGTGFGSYPNAYEKHSLTKASDFAIKEGFDFNSQDGNSLLFRLTVETGIIGIVFLFILIFKCFVSKQNGYADSLSWIVSSSCLVIIILYLIRQGNYFLNGFPLFVWMYYYTSVNYRNYKNKVSG